MVAEEALDISPKGDGGILKRILQQGDEQFGKPFSGDRVSVHYTGKLEDGTVFDSSVTRGTKFEFNLGKGEVIKGWDVGIASMNRGEKAEFTLKSQYGYGEVGSPPKIPPGATLIFEVELFEFKGKDVTAAQDGGVTLRIMEQGKGYENPNDLAKVEISLIGRLDDGKIFDSRENVQFVLGEGSEEDIPKGLEDALLKMKGGDVGEIRLTSKYGFGSEGNSAKSVPKNSNLTYTVTLLRVEKSKEAWMLNGEEKLEYASSFKQSGTEFFKASKYEMALKKYQKVVDFLATEISLKGEKEEERVKLLLAGRLNAAQCHLKLEDWIEARNVCDEIIKDHENNEKAFFRRGEAHLHLRDYDLAKEDYKTVLRIDSGNTAAKNRITACDVKIKQYKNKEKKTFANMFDKFAANDLRQEEEAKKKIKPVEISEWADKEGAGGEKKNRNTIKVSGDVEMDLDPTMDMEDMPR